MNLATYRRMRVEFGEGDMSLVDDILRYALRAGLIEEQFEVVTEHDERTGEGYPIWEEVLFEEDAPSYRGVTLCWETV